MSLRGEFVRLRCGTAVDMDGYLVFPQRKVRGALVVVQEIFGVNAALREIADDLAAEGFICLVPDIFWRLERRVELGNGEEGPLRAKALELMRRYDIETGVADLAAAADWLR